MSPATEVAEVSVLLLLFQTESAMAELSTVVLEAIIKVLFSLIKSPFTWLPQEIKVGQVPKVVEAVNEK